MIDSALYSLFRKAIADELDARGYRPPEHAPELVKLSQVKRWVQVSASTLKRWIADGRLKCFGEGRLAQVRLDDVRSIVMRTRLAAVPDDDEASPEVGRILATFPGRKR